MTRFAASDAGKRASSSCRWTLPRDGRVAWGRTAVLNREGQFWRSFPLANLDCFCSISLVANDGSVSVSVLTPGIVYHLLLIDSSLSCFGSPRSRLLQWNIVHGIVSIQRCYRQVRIGRCFASRCPVSVRSNHTSRSLMGFLYWCGSNNPDTVQACMCSQGYLKVRSNSV